MATPPCTTIESTYLRSRKLLMGPDPSEYADDMASVSVSSAFSFQELLMKSAGFNAYATATRSIYGAGATVLMGGADAGSFVNAGAGLFAGVAITAIFAGGGTLTLGGAIALAGAAGIGATLAGVILESGYDAYVRYSNQNASAPPVNHIFNESTNSTTVYLPTLYVPGDDVETDLSIEFMDMIGDMHHLIDRWNDNFKFNIGNFTMEFPITFDDIIELDYDEWTDFINDSIGVGVEFTDGIKEEGSRILSDMKNLIEEIIDFYDENHEKLDDFDPTLSEKIGLLAENYMGFVNANLGRNTPLVLDLDGDGVETISIFESNATFDFGSEQSPHAWISSDDGFLAIDKNHNEIIDDISELFGSKERDGFSILADYDTNSDGMIDEQDGVFSSLMIWRDLNEDGITDKGEINHLSFYGIKSINLNIQIDDAYQNMNWLPISSSYTTENGSNHIISDAYLATYFMAAQQSMLLNDDSYVLIGGSSGDVFHSNYKSQIFFGGGGADRFVFAGEIGNDIIVDFQAVGDNHDVIDLSGRGVIDFSDLSECMYETEDGVIIEFDNDNSIEIIGMPLSGLSSDNFLIA